jgi:MFS family permease
MLPISGRLSEPNGPRRVFLGSVVAFTVASVGCGLVDDIFTLIALRAEQAAGGAGFTPSATVIIVVIGRHGVSDVVMPDMSPDEAAALARSAGILKDAVDQYDAS